MGNKVEFTTGPMNRGDISAEDGGQALIANLYPPTEKGGDEDGDGIFVRLQSWHEYRPDEDKPDKRDLQALKEWHPEVLNLIQPGKKYRVTIEEIS
jgi:hypothetical protein